MDFIKNLPFPDHAFCSDLARPWIPMDRGYHISMFFKKSVPGFHFRQNPWISSKIYPSQTMPFDQIWPDLGFLWIGGIIFQCFSKNMFQDFTLDKIHGFNQTYNTKIIDLSDFVNSLIFKKKHWQGVPSGHTLKQNSSMLTNQWNPWIRQNSLILS